MLLTRRSQAWAAEDDRIMRELKAQVKVCAWEGMGHTCARTRATGDGHAAVSGLFLLANSHHPCVQTDQSVVMLLHHPQVVKELRDDLHQAGPGQLLL